MISCIKDLEKGGGGGIEDLARMANAELEKKSISWYKEKLSSGTPGKIREGVIQFEYQASTVAWYDKFPLIIFLQLTREGFSGLNLHYLPPTVRVKFLNHVATPGSDKINIRNFSRDRRFKATVKNYNPSRIVGSPINIEVEDYSMVASLPSERFFNISKEQVWNKA